MNLPTYLLPAHSRRFPLPLSRPGVAQASLQKHTAAISPHQQWHGIYAPANAALKSSPQNHIAASVEQKQLPHDSNTGKSVRQCQPHKQAAIIAVVKWHVLKCTPSISQMHQVLCECVQAIPLLNQPQSEYTAIIEEVMQRPCKFTPSNAPVNQPPCKCTPAIASPRQS